MSVIFFHCACTYRWLYLVTHWPISSQPVGLLCIYFLLWAIGRTLFPEHTYPSSVLMRMSFLFVGAQLCGILITFVRLPEMLGMVCFGILFTNLGWGNFSEVSGLETLLRYTLHLCNILRGYEQDTNRTYILNFRKM